MLVSKNAHTDIFPSKLTVDKWEVKYNHNTLTGEDMLVESYIGEENMESTNSHKYLGFVLSSTGDNSVNINAMKRKSIWLIRKIFVRLDVRCCCIKKKKHNIKNIYFGVLVMSNL